jgi:hypothetical protein
MNLNKAGGLTNMQIISYVATTLVAALAVTLGAQYLTEIDRVTPGSMPSGMTRNSYEISKLDAEIRQIRSDTAGSLFALRLIALFVTVGGAVGGYLIGQSRATKARIGFEDRKNVDEVYQSIVRELSSDSSILRAAAAVKLGAILKAFPAEWSISDDRKEQLVELTKQVLAAALAIEENDKALKTLTINLALHKSPNLDGLFSIKDIDLSGAKALNAYWAKCDFSNSDFFMADLSESSFRKSLLSFAQFRQATLTNAIFDDADCTSTNFKLADLRGASFANAELSRTSFEGARVYSVKIVGARISDLPYCLVDLSKDGDGSQMTPVGKWVNSLTDIK